MNDIQKVENNNGNNALNNFGKQIYKQVNNYFSFSNQNNKIEIIVDSDKIKKDYHAHYLIFEEELDGIFDNIEQRHINQLLCNLLDIKSEIYNAEPNLIIYTQAYLNLNQNQKKSSKINEKKKLAKEIEEEKIKCKELSLLFDLFFKNVIELDEKLIITIIYLLLTTEARDSWVEDNKIIDFAHSFESKEYIGFSTNELRSEIYNFLRDNVSENIIIPSTYIFKHKTISDFGIIVKYPQNKKVGLTKINEVENELKAKFFNELIHEIILCDISDYNSYLYIENYEIKLTFTNNENDIRSILPKYIYRKNGDLLKKFKNFQFFLKNSNNPI